MCDPVSLTIAATAVAAVGTITSGVATYQQKQTQAAFEERNAELARQQGLDEELQFREQARRKIATQTAQFAKAGVRLDTGAPLVTLRESARVLEADAQAIRYRAALQAESFEAQAALTRSEGRGALVGGILGAGAKALSGASRIAQITG